MILERARRGVGLLFGELARDREIRVQVLLASLDVRKRDVEQCARRRAAVAERRGELGDRV